MLAFIFTAIKNWRVAYKILAVAIVTLSAIIWCLNITIKISTKTNYQLTTLTMWWLFINQLKYQLTALTM